MTIEVVNHGTEPVEITNFTKTRYVDRDFMAREWPAVWCTSWLVAGTVADLEQPGDFFVFDIGSEQVLVTRTSTGDIQGYYNVCQHRGNVLVTQERGHASNFRCAYHAWTYSIDGELSAIPYRERFSGDVPCEQLSLKKVHTQTWGGLVFVNFSEAPESLERYLGETCSMLDVYRFDKMTLVQDQTVRLECNWKAVVDNFSELYHVDFLHPQHRRMVDCCNDTVHLYPHGHTGVLVPGATYNPRFPVPQSPTDIHASQLEQLGLDPRTFEGRVPEIRRAVQLRKREVGAAMGFDYSELSDDQLSDVWQFNLFPNVMLSFTPGHLWLLRVRPDRDDPNRCVMDKLSFVMFADPALVQTEASAVEGRTHANMAGVKPASYVRPERDLFDYAEVIAGRKSMTDTIDQDVELLGGVQTGMNSAGFERTFLNDDEIRVQHFHNEIDRRLAKVGA